MKIPLIAIPKFAKKHPKRQAHIHIPCQRENPPPAIYIKPSNCLTSLNKEKKEKKNKQLLAGKRSRISAQAIPNFFLVNARWISNCPKGTHKMAIVT